MCLKNYSAFKDVFGSFLCASYCADIRILKPRGCGFESRRKRNILFFNFPISKNSINKLLQHDVTHKVKDFGPLFV